MLASRDVTFLGDPLILAKSISFFGFDEGLEVGFDEGLEVGFGKGLEISMAAFSSIALFFLLS